MSRSCSRSWLWFFLLWVWSFVGNVRDRSFLLLFCCGCSCSCMCSLLYLRFGFFVVDWFMVVKWRRDDFYFVSRSWSKIWGFFFVRK